MIVDLLFLTFLQESSSSMFLISNRNQTEGGALRTGSDWLLQAALTKQRKESLAWPHHNFTKSSKCIFQNIQLLNLRPASACTPRLFTIQFFRKCANELRGITEGSPQITASSSLFFHSKWENVRPSEIERELKEWERGAQWEPRRLSNTKTHSHQGSNEGQRVGEGWHTATYESWKKKKAF